MPDTTNTASPLSAAGLNAMRFGRGFLKRMLEKTPDEIYFSQAHEGANHAAWVVGHLASTDDFILSSLSGRPSALPPEWAKPFVGGSVCHPDASKYPPRAELERKLDETRAALEEWYTSLTDEQLATPVQGDLAMFIPAFSAIGASCSFHDAFHSAQISASRRASGLPPMF